jgi:hypothetical protein
MSASLCRLGRAAWCAASVWWKPVDADSRVFTGAPVTVEAAGAGCVVWGSGAAPVGRTRTVRTASVPAAWFAAATIRALISRSWVA